MPLLFADMNGFAILNLLFGTQIADRKITDADSMIWRVGVDSADETSIRLTVSSHCPGKSDGNSAGAIRAK